MGELVISHCTAVKFWGLGAESCYVKIWIREACFLCSAFSVSRNLIPVRVGMRSSLYLGLFGY
jgi:hypothetical protein